jgi:hypothetical protein
MSLDPIDLRLLPYGVLAGDEAAGAANAKAISQAIADHPVNTRFVLPMGRIYVSRDLSGVGIYRFAAIRINGSNIHDITLTGWGPGATELVMTGSQAGGLSQILQIADGPSRVLLSDFSISHGPNVTDIDTVGLQNHQVELNAVNGDVTDCEIRNIHFGTCIGDAIRNVGGISTYLVNTRVHDVTMRLSKHPRAPLGCRSGISFQKGIKDYDFGKFYIIGSKNSPFDCEPTAASVMDNIWAHDGTIDNSESATPIAASFDGFESSDPSSATSFLTNSRMTNVTIVDGQLQILSTKGCTLDNVVITSTGRGGFEGAADPLLLIFRENVDLELNNLSIIRDAGCTAGPLVYASHARKSPLRINVDGGTWTTKVGPGRNLSYVVLLDTDYFRIRGTRIRIDDPATGQRYAVTVRPGNRDLTNVRLHDVTVESPNARLTAAFWFAAITHNIRNVSVTGCSANGAVIDAVRFDASDGGEVDSSPVLQGNDFDGCANAWTTDHTAVGRVFPIIGGNRGGRTWQVGTVIPEGIVAAVQGSRYTHQNGDATVEYYKRTGTGDTGWSTVTIP